MATKVVLVSLQCGVVSKWEHGVSKRRIRRHQETNWSDKAVDELVDVDFMTN